MGTPKAQSYLLKDKDEQAEKNVAAMERYNSVFLERALQASKISQDTQSETVRKSDQSRPKIVQMYK